MHTDSVGTMFVFAYFTYVAMFSHYVLRMYDVEKHSAVLENAAGFARLDAHIHCPVTKWQLWDMLIHWRNKLHVRPNVVQLRMPPTLIS